MEERIQDYLDGICSQSEAAEVLNKINTDGEWKERYEALQAVHTLLAHDLETMQPSMRFTKNVMEEVSGLTIAKPVRLRNNPWIFRSAGGILGTLLLYVMVQMFGQIDLSSAGKSSPIPMPTVSMPEVNWGQYLGGGTTLLLFMICTVLGFVLLDKWLTSRRKAH